MQVKYAELYAGVGSEQGFKAGAYEAQLVRGAPGDGVGHGGLGGQGGLYESKPAKARFGNGGDLAPDFTASMSYRGEFFGAL